MLLINWIACALAELWRPFVWHQHRLTARSELICSISSFIFSALSLSLVISVQSLCAHCVFVHLLFVVANYRDDLYSSFRYCTCCNKPNYSCHFVYCSQAALFAYITQSHGQEWGKKMLSVLGIVIRIALDWDFNWVFFVLPNNDEARKQLFSSLIYCCLAVENWAQHSSEALFWASPRKCSTKLLGTIRCHFGPPHDRVQRAGVTSFDLLFFAVVDAAAFAASVFCRLLCFFFTAKQEKCHRSTGNSFIKSHSLFCRPPISMTKLALYRFAIVCVSVGYFAFHYLLPRAASFYAASVFFTQDMAVFVLADYLQECNRCSVGGDILHVQFFSAVFKCKLCIILCLAANALVDESG